VLIDELSILEIVMRRSAIGDRQARVTVSQLGAMGFKLCTSDYKEVQIGERVVMLKFCFGCLFVALI
jgi:hypothetical protein